MDKELFTDAIRFFQQAKDYLDSEEKIEEAETKIRKAEEVTLAQKYEYAESLYASKNYTKAARLFAEIKGYSGAEIRAIPYNSL